MACAAAVIALVATVTTQQALKVAAAQPNHGLYASSVIYNGQIHVFEFQFDAHLLEHAWWDGTRWNHEYLDGPGIGGGHGRTGDGVGDFNSTIVYNGQLQDFYFDDTNQRLRHAWWDGSSWNFESLDGPGVGGGNGRTSHHAGEDNSAVVYNGQLQDFYLDDTSIILRHAWWDGSSWHFENLDGPGVGGGNGRTTDQVGLYNSAIVYNGQLQDFYGELLGGNLRHAWWDGTRWNFEYLDGSMASTPGHAGNNTNVGAWNSSIIYNGQLHDFYEDTNTGKLRHAWWNGAGWNTEELDGSAADGSGATDNQVGQATATTKYNGQLQVFYSDDGPAGNGPHAVRHAWFSGSWNREVLDGTGSKYVGHINDDVGNTFQTTSLIYNGQIQVFAADLGPPLTLEHDWWNGSKWFFEQLA